MDYTVKEFPREFRRGSVRMGLLMVSELVFTFNFEKKHFSVEVERTDTSTSPSTVLLVAGDKYK